MTQQEFDILLKHPEKLAAGAVGDLRDLLEQYPYFAPARMLYLRALKLSDSILFEKELARTAVYAHDRRWLYFFLYPEQKEEPGRKYVRPSKASGDYFGMLRSVESEGGDVDRSLKALAERLKKARMDVAGEVGEKAVSPTVKRVEVPPAGRPAVPSTAGGADGSYAEKVRSLIRNGKYEDALVILKELNLNNPKKSIYFADQIRFVEKIIESKK